MIFPFIFIKYPPKPPISTQSSCKFIFDIPIQLLIYPFSFKLSPSLILQWPGLYRTQSFCSYWGGICSDQFESFQTDGLLRHSPLDVFLCLQIELISCGGSIFYESSQNETNDVIHSDSGAGRK